MRKCYTVKEAATVLGVTDRTIWNYLRTGKLSSVAAKGRKRRKARPGRGKTQIDTISLLKLKMRVSGVYGIRDMIISYMEQFERDRFRIRRACKEMGIPQFDVDLSSWDDVEADRALEGMEDKLDPLMNYRQAAAFLNVQIRTIQRYIQQGKLKVEKRNPETGENLFSMVKLTELYRELHGVTIQGNEQEGTESIQEIFSFLKNHPYAVDILRNSLDSIE